MFAASRQERGGKNNDDHSDGKKIKQNHSYKKTGRYTGRYINCDDYSEDKEIIPIFSFVNRI